MEDRNQALIIANAITEGARELGRGRRGRGAGRVWQDGSTIKLLTKREAHEFYQRSRVVMDRNDAFPGMALEDTCITDYCFSAFVNSSTVTHTRLMSARRVSLATSE